MTRLSYALRDAGYRPIVLSPATSLRAVRAGGPILYPGRVRRHGGMMVIYAPALNVIGLNMLTTLFFQISLVVRLMRRPLAGGIVYNFSPSLLFLTAWLTLKPNLRVVNNIEDVSIPALSDWSRRTEARPVQQLVFWVCMNLIARMSDAYIVPTQRFLSYLPRKRSVEVVTGCIEIPPTRRTAPKAPPLRVLYVGKVESEHGIVQFVEALIALDATPAANRIQVDISGAGSMSGWVTERLREIETMRVTQHGFVSTTTYRTLLNDAHVCVALQDPLGRYANFKTPSKIYEFLGYGKAVIATDVGDIRNLPEDILIVLDRLDADQIATHLTQMSESPSRVDFLQKNARHHAINNFSYGQVGQRLKLLIREDY